MYDKNDRNNLENNIWYLKGIVGIFPYFRELMVGVNQYIDYS